MAKRRRATGEEPARTDRRERDEGPAQRERDNGNVVHQRPSFLALAMSFAMRSRSSALSFSFDESTSVTIACSIDPSKNVLTTCASADRRASLRLTVGAYT